MEWNWRFIGSRSVGPSGTLWRKSIKAHRERNSKITSQAADKRILNSWRRQLSPLQLHPLSQTWQRQLLGWEKIALEPIHKNQTIDHVFFFTSIIFQNHWFNIKHLVYKKVRQIILFKPAPPPWWISNHCLKREPIETSSIKAESLKPRLSSEGGRTQNEIAANKSTDDLVVSWSTGISKHPFH